MVNIYKNQLDALSKDYRTEDQRQAAHAVYTELMNQGIKFPYMDTRMILDSVIRGDSDSLDEALSTFNTVQEIISDMGYDPSQVSRSIKEKQYGILLMTHRKLNQLFPDKFRYVVGDDNQYYLSDIPVSNLNPEQHAQYVTVPAQNASIESLLQERM